MINNKIATKFLYIQLLNFCIQHGSCNLCTYSDSPNELCILFSGVFEELRFSGAVSQFESINQCQLIHRKYSCEKCQIRDSANKDDECGMIAFSRSLFYKCIMPGRSR